jgi:hypothetical protein
MPYAAEAVEARSTEIHVMRVGLVDLAPCRAMIVKPGIVKIRLVAVGHEGPELSDRGLQRRENSFEPRLYPEGMLWPRYAMG